MSHQTVVLVTRTLKVSPTYHDLLPAVDVGRTGARLLLGALAKLVEEHGVLLAAGLVLDDGVDAPSLGMGEALPSQGVP